MSHKNTILFEDADLLVVNKPAGVHSSETAVTHGDIKYEPAHRLDQGTSGCLVLASPSFLPALSALFKEHRLQEKLYIAGLDAPLGRLWVGHNIQGFVGSRYRGSKKVMFDEDELKLSHCRTLQPTRHRVLSNEDLQKVLDESGFNKETFSGTLCGINLVSGARHQIRSFLSYAKSPIVGDALYGKSASAKDDEDEGEESAQNFELHALRLKFEDPRSTGNILTFTAAERLTI